ncbi:hypothetical protein DESC_930031 [Desulfosarcina cetonica]|uniref:hypothetical protein n=1 Tax=Desulfosarcina cetonica TaxID=90730 RepID=UPI0006D0410B|nr:hypothetical protein [Desulfosarcina cetonica]VTR71364.1 hypothetical protein DESC_930031 [Desulfosarcina cetonica]
MIDLNLYHRKSEFERTGNPLYAWDMILECRKENKSFPQWVLDYLEVVADELLDLEPPKGKAPAQIRDAMGFKGKPFEEYRRFRERGSKQEFDCKLKMYYWIEARLTSEKSKEEVFMAAGREFYGEDPDTDDHLAVVRKNFYEIEKIFNGEYE